MFRRRAARPEPTSSVSTEEPLFDEALLASIRHCSLTPRRIANEGLAGEHRSRRRGSSPEFADFKAYSHGDDFRRIDWNIYSRIGALFVRLSEVTTELPVHVLLDSSASMDWRSSRGSPTKFTVARRLSGLLAFLALQRFDRVTIVPFADRFGTQYGPAQGRSSIHPMLSFVSGLRAGGPTLLPRMLDQYARERKRAGFLVLVSDLLSGEPAELATALRALRSHGWDIVILQILDPAELDPGEMIAAVDERDAVELVDAEGGGRLRVALDAATADRCRAATLAWLDQLDAACAGEEVPLLRVDSSISIESLVRELSEARVIG